MSVKKGIGLSFDIGNWPNVSDKTGAACQSCNSSKNARPMLKWAFQEGRVESLRQMSMEVL